MKNFLFCLMLLAGFAAANTCTEAIFILSKGSLDITQDKAYHDSSYFVENYGHKNEWSHKLFYTDGKIDSLVFNPMEDDDSIHVSYFYWNLDESALKGSISESIITQELYNGQIKLWTNKINKMKYIIEELYSKLIIK